MLQLQFALHNVILKIVDKECVCVWHWPSEGLAAVAAVCAVQRCCPAHAADLSADSASAPSPCLAPPLASPYTHTHTHHSQPFKMQNTKC